MSSYLSNMMLLFLCYFLYQTVACTNIVPLTSGSTSSFAYDYLQTLLLNCVVVVVFLVCVKSFQHFQVAKKICIHSRTTTTRTSWVNVKREFIGFGLNWFIWWDFQVSSFQVLWMLSSLNWSSYGTAELIYGPSIKFKCMKIVYPCKPLFKHWYITKFFCVYCWSKRTFLSKTRFIVMNYTIQ